MERREGDSSYGHGVNKNHRAMQRMCPVGEWCPGIRTDWVSAELVHRYQSSRRITQKQSREYRRRRAVQDVGSCFNKSVRKG